MTVTLAPKNKQQIILEAIRNGGATKETLMKAADVNKAGFASQLAYLRARGLSMAEVDPSKAEFPMTNDEGVYFMGTYAQYQEDRKTFGTTATPKTAKEILDAAQKREDRASAAYSKAADKAKTNPEDLILAKIVEVKKAEMELASMKLSALQNGDFSYESTPLAPDVAATVANAAAKSDSKAAKAAKTPETAPMNFV